MSRYRTALPRGNGSSAKNRRANVRADCSTYEQGSLFAGLVMALLFGVCCIFEAVLG